MTFSAYSALLANKVLVLAEIESTYNTDAAPVVADDAFLVSDVDFRVDPNVLERNVVRPSISPEPISLGRKLVSVTLTHELKASGSVGTAPKIGKLLRACGFAETTIGSAASATIQTPAYGTGASSPAQGATFAKSGTVTKTGRYRLTVVKAGASGTAKLRCTGIPATPDETTMPLDGSAGFSAAVSSGATMTLAQGLTSAGDYSSITYTVGGVFAAGNVLTATVGGVDFAYTVVSGDTNTDGAATSLAALIDADPRFAASAASSVVTVTFATNSATSSVQALAVTSGTTAIPIGDTGGSITPTWSGSLVLGDYWDVQVLEPGVHYTPVSQSFESITLYVYRDGLLHKVTGCMGNAVFNGESGSFGSVNFTFTGQYVRPTDTAMPSIPANAYESTIPHQIENAQLALRNNDNLCAQSFSVDMQNQIVHRDCMNNSDGFNGVTITSRNPQGSVNPEATLQANHPVWQLMEQSTQLPFHVRVGTVAGNIVKIIAEGAQYAGVTYSDRNRILVNDISLRFARYSSTGNDEVRVIFN